MLNSILSGDYPRSKILTATLLIIVICLAFAPFLFDGPVAYKTATLICLYITLVASYDILLGYTAIVSFAHLMFYGIGAYAMAIAFNEMGPTWGALGVGLVGGVLCALLVALVLALFSLRVKAIFFALVTLAVATGFLIVVRKLYGITGGEDGLIYRVPALFGNGFKLSDTPWYGFDIPTFLETWSFSESLHKVRMSGKIVIYYVIFIATTVMFLAMLRMMNSPFGRVCQAIRENEFRAEALGYKTVYFRTINVCVAAVFASIAGALMALTFKYVGPDTSLGFHLMVNVLLMTVIGGMGTLYGAIVGAALFVMAENYLNELMKFAYQGTEGIPVLNELVNPDRWIMWLGILFVLSVYFFPRGVVGQLRIWAANRERGKATTGGEQSASA